MKTVTGKNFRLQNICLEVEDKSQVIKKHINNSKMEISFQLVFKYKHN